MSYLVGIDLGSGACKVAIVDEQGNLMGEALREYVTSSPHPGWTEQNPEEWVSAVEGALEEAVVKGQIHPREISGIAVSGTTHSFVLTDKHDKTLRPCILWTDCRSDREVKELLEAHKDEIFKATLHYPDVHWTLPQLLWIKHNEPHVWNQMHRLFMPKDYLRFILTGKWATDWVDALGTLLLDAQSRKWSQEMCDLIGLPLETLPPVEPPTQLAGTVTRAAAKTFGLFEGTPVIVGSTDQAAEALGSGAIASGQGIIKLATAGNIAVVTKEPHPSPPEVKAYYHIIPSLRYTLKGMTSCASNYRWLRDSFFDEEIRLKKNQLQNAYSFMDHLAEKVPLGCKGLIFYPHLRGINAYPYVRGCFFGITPEHGIAHFVRAVLEGVAFGVYDGVEKLQQLGVAVDNFRIIGGGAKSPLWRQIISDVTGMPLLKPRLADSSFGTALIAGLGAGVFSSAEHAVSMAASIEETVSPNMDDHDIYMRLYEVYRKVEDDLHGSFRMLSEVMASI